MTAARPGRIEPGIDGCPGPRRPRGWGWGWGWGTVRFLAWFGVPLLVAAPALPSPDPFAECAAVLSADPDGWKSCGCYYVTGRSLGRAAEAARLIEILRRDRPESPCPAFYLGRLRYESGDDAEAERLLTAAAEGYAARREWEGATYARLNLSRVFSRRGTPEPALAQLDAARRAAEAHTDPVLRAQVRLQQALGLLQAGQDLAHIRRLLRGIEPETLAAGPATLRRDTAMAEGNVAYLLGDYPEAEYHYRRMIEHTRGAQDLPGEAAAWQSLAKARLAQALRPAERGEMVTLLRRALEVALAARQPHRELSARLLLGRFLREEEGRRHLERGLQLARSTGDSEALARGLETAALRALSDDPAAALRLLTEARTAAARAPSVDAGLYGWSSRMEVLWSAGPRQDAVAEGLATLDLIEGVRDLQRAEGSRGELFAVWTQIYHALVGRLLDPAGDGSQPPVLGLAFDVGERMRARLLLEALDASKIVESEPPESPWAQRQLERLQRLVDVNRQLLDPALPAQRRRILLDELENLEAQRLETQEARGATAEAASPDEDFATLEEVRSRLRQDEALLSFLLAPSHDIYGTFIGGSWLLAVTSQEARAYRLPDRRELEAAVEIFLDHIARRDGSEQPIAHRLHDILLRPALDQMPAGVRHLKIVPDGALHRLPFGALRDAEDEPVITRFLLGREPSATVWLRRTSPPSSVSSEPLALADPLSAGGHGPLPSSAGLRGSPLARGASLAPLPFARREGRAVVQWLGGRLLVGESASEAAVKEHGDGARLLHFAAHALIDTEHPERTALVLSPGTPREDGLLQPREIAALDLRGTVVALSTCSSADGAVLAGEGPLSLARAFFSAGASTVVGSLWPLRDDDAAALFEDFYRHVGRGATVAEALTAAQSARARAGEPAATWAGVSVFGDGDATLEAAPSRSQRLRRSAAAVAVAAGILLAAAIWWWRRRSARRH